MTRKEDLIARIVESEWRMFVNVPNAGGIAACQEDPATFEIMRSSQAMSWSEEALESYLDDLTDAEQNNRNLLTEKYARMMQSTTPSEYAEIKHLLPPLEPDVLPLIDKIVEIVLAWTEELALKYPYVVERGRPIHSSEDTPYQTSMETYLRGELATFSSKTLRPYYENILRLQSQDLNGSETTLDHTVKRYGYKSLQEANERIKAQVYMSNLQ